MFRKITRLLLAGGLAVVGGLANAQSNCDVILSLYSSAVQAGNPASAQLFMAENPQCFGGSTTTSQVQINNTSFQQVSAISGALASRLLSVGGPGPQADAGARGVAAGGVGKSWNVWGNIAGSNTRQNYTNAGITVGNDNDVTNTVVGVDYALSPTMVVGVSAAFDRGDGSSQTSVGGAPTNMSSKGYAIAPYLGMQLSKELAIDASAGIGSGKLNMSGNTTAEADRWFAGANLSYNQWMGSTQITGKLGYLHGEENYGNSVSAGVINNGTGAKNKLDQLRAGVQAGYWMASGVMPYAGLGYSADLARSTTQFGAFDPIGKSAWVWTLGVNFFSLASGVTGGIAYNQEDGRTNQKNKTWVANVSFRF